MMALAVLLATAAVATNVPRLEDCRVVYVHEPGTTVLNAPDGTVCIDQEPRPFHDECRARYAKREMPFPYRRLRDYVNTNEFLPRWSNLEVVDRQGGAWYQRALFDDRKLVVSQINDRSLKRVELPRSFHANDRLPRFSPVGRAMFADHDGSVWVMGTDRIHRIANGKTTEVILPVPAHATQADDFLGQSHSEPYWSHQIYRFGDSLWIVRSFDRNCSEPGSFVLRVDHNQAECVAWIPRGYVTGLIAHREGILALVDEYTTEGTLVPGKVLSGWREIAPAVLQQKIADLDGDSAVREAASQFLASAPPIILKRLREALRTPKSLEQKLRLEEAIAAITALPHPPPFAMEGLTAGRLLFVDREGRQYVQPWTNNPTAVLLVFDVRNTSVLRLPSANWVMDHQGQDGVIYCRDAQFLYALPSGNGELRPLAKLPTNGATVEVIASWKELLCLQITKDKRSVNVWMDLTTRPDNQPLAGNVIAENLLVPPNGYFNHHPVAIGPSDKLWFLAGQTTLTSTSSTTEIRIGHAIGPRVKEGPGQLVLASCPSIWPIGTESAILVTIDGYGAPHAAFHDHGRTVIYPSLYPLLEAQYTRLQELLPDGYSLRSGEDNGERVSLTRLGDTFYVEGTPRWTDAATISHAASSGFFRNGHWLHETTNSVSAPHINRWSAADITTHRILGFQDAWKVLRWIPIASDAGAVEELARQSEAWAWHWYDHTHLPRYAGAWTLMPEAATHLIAVTPQRQAESKQRGEDETRFNSADFANFRTWTNSRWRESGFSLYGSEPWSDGSGGVWFFRVREVEVLFADGHRQLIPLDAGLVDRYRLAIESPDAVWVASQESLTRFRLERDKDKRPSRWVKDRIFRLPAFGLGFAGPWITGENLYYVADGKLFHVSLAELLRASVPHH